MKLVMVGLGKMGGNMAERLRRGGHEVVGFDAFAVDRSDAATLAEAVTALGAGGHPDRVGHGPGRRAHPAGRRRPRRRCSAAGDLVIDGGNSRYVESMARGAALAEKQIGFIDCGTSGGVGASTTATA